MFEIGDIVKFRTWTNKLWEEGTWIIIEVEWIVIWDDVFYSYTLQSQETGRIHSEVNWQQIELI